MTSASCYVTPGLAYIATQVPACVFATFVATARMAPHGSVTVPVHKIASERGCSVRTIQRHMGKLEMFVQRIFDCPENGRPGANTYRIIGTTVTCIRDGWERRRADHRASREERLRYNLEKAAKKKKRDQSYIRRMAERLCEQLVHERLKAYFRGDKIAVALLEPYIETSSEADNLQSGLGERGEWERCPQLFRVK